jgi:hypothetical protein
MLLLLPWVSCLPFLPCFGVGRFRAGLLKEDDEQDPRDLVAIGVFFGVLFLCLEEQLSWSSQWCGLCLCTRICTAFVRF